MSTNNAETIGFSLSMGNIDDRPECNLRVMTLERVLKIIDRKNYDARLTAELKKVASAYPQQALENFVKNFDTHLLRARKAVRLSKPTVAPIETTVVDEKAQEENNHAPQETEFD